MRSECNNMHGERIKTGSEIWGIHIRYLPGYGALYYSGNVLTSGGKYCLPLHV